METLEDKKLKAEIKKKVFHIFKDFMTNVAKLDELVIVGGRLLAGFQQGLEFLQRPPINKTSKLIESIIKANEIKGLRSYLDAGCINGHDMMQNMSKLKNLQNDLESLLEDARAALQVLNEKLCPPLDRVSVDRLDLQESSGEDELTSSHYQEPEVTDYAVLMRMVYSMVKQEIVMQDKIVSSVNLKSTSGELDSYCPMWSLRPFIKDQVMHVAWELFP